MVDSFFQDPDEGLFASQAPQEEKGLLDFDDLLFAPFRATEGLARGVIGLIDIIPGVDTGIGEGTRLSGEPDTALGGLLTGVMEFALGFVPVAGALGKAGKVRALGRTVDFAGRTVKDQLVKGAVAGAVVDFAGYDGNEARLSNLLQEYPALQSPVTEFLAADEDDPEVVGRLKNAIEGLGIGMIAEGLIMGLKGIARGRKVIQAGGTREEAQKAAEAAVESAEETKRMFGPEEAALPGSPNIFEEPPATAAPTDAPDFDSLGLFVQTRKAAAAGTRPEDQAAYEGHIRTLYEGGLISPGQAQVLDLAAAGSDYAFVRGQNVFGQSAPADLHLSRIKEGPEEEVSGKVLGVVSDGSRTNRPPRITIDPEAHAGSPLSGVVTYTHELGHVVTKHQGYSHPIQEIYHILLDELGEDGLKDFIRTRLGVQSEGYVEYFAKNADEFAAQAFSHTLLTRGSQIGEAHGLKKAVLEVWDGVVQRIMKALNLADPTQAVKDDAYKALTVLNGLAMGISPRRGKTHSTLMRLTSMLSSSGSESLSKIAKTKLGEAPDLGDLADLGAFKGQKKPLAVPSSTYRMAQGSSTLPKPQGVASDKPPLSRKDSGLNALSTSLLGVSDEGLEGLRAALKAEDGRTFDEIVENLQEFSGFNFGVLPAKTPVGQAARPGALGEEVGTARVIEAIEDILISRGKVKGMTDKETVDSALEYAHKLATAADHEPVSIMHTLAGDLEAGTAATRELATRMAAANIYIAQSARQINRMIAEGADQGAIDAAIQAQTRLMQSLNGARTSSGSTLRTLRASLSPEDEAVQSTAKYLAGIKDDKARAKAAQMLQALTETQDPQDLAALTKFLAQTGGKKTADRLTYAFMNSILSGGRTVSVNVVSPGIIKSYEWAAQLVGGGMQALMTGDNSTLRRAFLELEGMRRAFKDAMKIGRKAWNLNRSTFNFESHAAFMEGRNYNKPFSAASLGIDPESSMGGLADMFDKVVGAPMRALGATDDAIKHLVARGSVYADLMQEGMRRNLDGADLVDFVERGTDKAVGQGRNLSNDQMKLRGYKAAQDAGITDPFELEMEAQRFVQTQRADKDHGVIQKIADRAEADAKFATQTHDLREGSMTKRAQAFVLEHPLLKLFFPFFKTPVNLLTTAADNMPFYTGAKYIAAYGKALKRGVPLEEVLAESHSRLLRDLASPDDSIRWAARGRFNLSMGVTLWGIGMASSGRITGRGPEDPELRAAMQQAGWMPYSIRVDSPISDKPKFVQYSRLDPFSTILGAMADYTEALRLGGEQDQGEIEKVFAGFITTLTSQLTEKSYLQGLSNIVSILDDPTGGGARTVTGMFSAVIPNALAQGAQAAEGEMKELNGLIDTLRARIPWLEAGRKGLAPRRNILGEVVHRPKAVGEDALGAWVNAIAPVMYREVSDDMIFQELTALKHGFQPPKPQMLGFDLRNFQHPGGQDAWDRWQQLTGRVKIGDRTLRAALKKLLKSKDYQRMDPISTVEFDSPRVRAIRAVLQRYRSKAFQEVLTEIPELKAQYAGARKRQQEAKASGNYQALVGTESGLPTYIEQIQGTRPRTLF